MRSVGDARPAALLCDRLRVTLDRSTGGGRSGDEADSVIGGVNNSLGMLKGSEEGRGISISAMPRFDLTSRYVGALLAPLLDEDPALDKTGAVPKGIPGPSGGSLSLFSATDGSTSSSSCVDSLVDNFDLARGVDVRGGNTKSDCFAVSGSSSNSGGANDLLAPPRPRAGERPEGWKGASSGDAPTS